MSVSGWGRITKRYRPHALWPYTPRPHISPWNVGTYLLGRGSDKERREGAAERPAVWFTRAGIQKDAEPTAASDTAADGGIYLHYCSETEPTAAHNQISVGVFFSPPRKDDYSQPDSQLASQLATGLTVMQLGSRCCLWRAALAEAVAHLGKQRFAGVWTHWLNKVTTTFPLQTSLIMIKEHFNSHVGYHKAWKLIRSEL